MSIVFLPIPLIILQLLTLSIGISIEAIVIHQKLRLTRKQSIEFSISINLLSTIVLWFVFFIFQGFAPESERLHLIGIIFFNNFNGLNLWIHVYPILAAVLVMMCALIIFVEFKSLQLLQVFLKSSAEQNNETIQNAIPLINRINTAIVKVDVKTIATIFQANALSSCVVALFIILLNVYQAQ
ncbi:MULTISPECIES: filament integrity protein FraC [Spirulina sp. CCY15215]|uniref:filament integrity protein FraC n=1 Tax=Spirulina sp. CCY15215 TaxID=2767591 RepID=UPI0019511DD5|nr:filament integrity protein FraC [Spirulina major]